VIRGNVHETGVNRVNVRGVIEIERGEGEGILLNIIVIGFL
jgi:hypothetical protein